MSLLSRDDLLSIAVYPDILAVYTGYFLQCFDAVAWVAGRASGL